jgi:hypothetical protein
VYFHHFPVLLFVQISRRFLALVVIVGNSLFATTALAQVPDSVQHRYDSLVKPRTTKGDSVSNRFNSRVDSMQLKANSILQPDFRKITSKLQRRNAKVPDSLHAVKELDSIKGGLRHKIDSLKGLNLSTEHYTSQLDSLNKLSPQKYIQLAQQEADDLRSKITSPVGDLQEKITAPAAEAQNKINEKLDLMKSQGGTDANLPGNININDKLQLPDAQLSGTDLQTKLNVPGVDVQKIDVQNPLNQIGNPVEGKMDNLNNIGEKASELKNMPQDKIIQVTQSTDVKNVTEKIGEGNALIDKGQAYQQDAMNIAQGNVGEVKQLPDALERKAASVADLGELQKQEELATGQLELLNKAKDPEALKAEMKKQVLTQAKDHFAGKQEALQQAMDKMSKLKSKYSELNSLADIPRRVPNAMKGKPLIERIVPGFNLQIQKSQYVLIDINPVLTYRISGRVSAGAGWNERYAFIKWNKLSKPDRIYGPRAHASFAVKKGFSVKAEGEKMNTWIPSFVGTPDGGRGWVWSVFVGIKKDYRFAKGVNGNAQILYNIYDDNDNSPYVEKLNVRMGFEFPGKKKPKKSAGK